MSERGARARVAVLLGLAAAATAGHVAYPAALWALTRHRADPQPPEHSGPWPRVTVVVAAYLEAAVIAEKIADCRRNGYRGELEVLVVADDSPTADVARSSGAVVLESGSRRGKSAALAAGLTAATGEIVVLTDANAALSIGSIERLVRWFDDPAVGAVAGEKRHSSGGQGVYWQFESWLKRREHRLGSTIGLVGECAALRRSTAPQLPDWAVVDDFWLAMSVMLAGDVIPYEPAAVATEAPSTPSEEWQRRTRIVAGALQMLWRRRSLLLPTHHLLAFEVWGHRLWRMTGGPLAHCLLLVTTVRYSRDDDMAGRLARGVVMSHLLAGFGLAAGERAPMPARALGQALYLQAVGIGGMLRLLSGGVSATWPKPERRVAA